MGLDMGAAGLTSVWAARSNVFWRNHGPRYFSADNGNRIVNIAAPPFDPNNRVDMVNAQHFMWYRDRRPEHILPTLHFTLDESFALGQDVATINQFVRQSKAEFVTGARDINNDAHWNAYLNDLNRMGLPRWIATSQAAFDRIR
jgi:putative aldouronate transport system substrate-binding protein